MHYLHLPSGKRYAFYFHDNKKLAKEQETTQSNKDTKNSIKADLATHNTKDASQQLLYTANF